jgi:hypothetical protein
MRLFLLVYLMNAGTQLQTRGTLLWSVFWCLVTRPNERNAVLALPAHPAGECLVLRRLQQVTCEMVAALDCLRDTRALHSCECASEFDCPLVP